MNPLVSVILLSHREEFFPRAVASVFAQTLPREDRQLIANHYVGAYPEKFNAPAACATGAWLVPFCDDDVLGPDYLAQCLAVGNRAGGADIIVTDRRMLLDGPEAEAVRDQLGLTEDGTWREFGHEYPVLPDIEPGVPGYYRFKIDPDVFVYGSTLPMTCMIRRTFWEKLGGYDPSVPHMDTELWGRAAQAGAMVHYIPRALWDYRKHGDVDVMPYLVAYNRKHFRRFGLDFANRSQVVIKDGVRHVAVLPVPPEEREAYIAEHYPELVGAT